MRQTTNHPPRWLVIAEGELGVREVRGRGHNLRILQYLKTALNLGNWGRSRDETAWCAAFCNWCLEQAGQKGTYHALARSFIDWGYPIETPRLGAIIVVRNGGNRDGGIGGFHVGFLISEGRYTYRILGGNQKNSVSYRNFSKRTYKLQAMRWPFKDPSPSTDRVVTPTMRPVCIDDTHT